MRRVVILVVAGLVLGVALTAVAAVLPGSHGPDPLTWLGTVATVAALVVAVGIYRVQQTQSDVAHQELLDALKAQDEILQELAEATPPQPSQETTPSQPDDSLTSAQREAVEARYGDRAIEAAWTIGDRRGARGGQPDRPRLVRLDDGTLVTVFNRGPGGRMQVHQVKPRLPRGERSSDRSTRRMGSR